VNNRNGYLVLIGGGEEKSGRKIVLRETVDLNHAKQAVIIPSASLDPLITANPYIDAFHDLGVENVEILDVRHKREADNDRNYEIISKSDLIFFSGGDQVKLVRCLWGTKLLRQIKSQYAAGITIAGTSAGASAVSDHVIYDGNRKGFHKGSVHVKRGLGFIKDVIIDTHFINRKRIARLSQHLASGKSDFGIGIAEDTGIIISPDRTFKVIGNSIVTILNSRDLRFTDYNEVAYNNMITTDDLRLSLVAPGSSYSLIDTKVIHS